MATEPIQLWQDMSRQRRTPTRVLVVDDDASVRLSLAAFLEDEGFEVRSSDCGAGALDVIAAETVHVAVVDLRLGDTDGERLIVRARDVRPETRFLIYTGSVGYRLPASLSDVGMRQGDVVHKPARPMKVLVDEIKRLAGAK
jgi:DNA-binding NtrC family response regulator